jgi:hypothetical protein
VDAKTFAIVAFVSKNIFVVAACKNKSPVEETFVDKYLAVKALINKKLQQKPR